MAQFIKSGLGYKRVFTKSELANIKLKNDANSIVAENNYLKSRLDNLESIVQQLVEASDLDISLNNEDNIESESEEVENE